MILKNSAIGVVLFLALAEADYASADCDCVDVAGIVDRGLQERAIRVAQRESGAYRSDLVLESVMLCGSEVIFRGGLPEKRKFEVRIAVAGWEELRATIK